MSGRASHDFMLLVNETTGVDQVDRVQRASAYIALVTTSILYNAFQRVSVRGTHIGRVVTDIGATMRACSLHEAIREEPVGWLAQRTP